MMSCDYCEQSGAVTAATGGLGRTFSRARWSAGRTDVQEWFEERRRQGAGRPVVQVAPVGSLPAPVPLPGLSSRYQVPHDAEAAAPLLNLALPRVLGHSDFVAEVRTFQINNPWFQGQEEVLALTHRSGEQPDEVWRPVWRCLGTRGRRCATLSAFFHCGDDSGSVPSIHTATRRLVSTAAARDLLRAVKEAPDYARLAAAGQAALYTVRLADSNVYETRLVLWSGGDAAEVQQFTLTSDGELREQIQGFSDAAFAQRFVEQEGSAWDAFQHCYACGYPRTPQGKCPCCRSRTSGGSKHWPALASQVNDPAPNRRP